MSLLFMDGFDHTFLTSGSGGGSAASRQKWDTTFLAGELYPTHVEGRFTSGALKIEAFGGQSWVQKSVGIHNELIMGFSFKTNSTHTTFIYFKSDLADPITSPRLTLVGNNGTGSLSVFTPGGASASSSGDLKDGDWVFVEFRIKLGTSDGEIEVKVDGVQVALTTGANTAGTATNLNAVRIESRNNAQNDFIDDFYVLSTTGSDNNTFLHNGTLTPRVTVLRPKANGSVNTFSPINDGADAFNWQAVDDSLANRATDYVQSSIIGASEDYTMQTFADVSVTAGTIHGIQVANNSINTGVAPVNFIDEMVISTARYTSGTTKVATTTDYNCSLYIRGTDPSDNAAWTESKVEAVGSAFSIVDPP